jgi:ATP-binding cassette, subfamily B, bacterial
MNAAAHHEDQIDVPVFRTMLRALRSVPELRKGIGVTFVFVIIGSLGRVSIPLLLRTAIDRGLGRTSGASGGAVDIGLVARLAAIGLGVAIVSTLGGMIANYRLGMQAERAMAALRGLMTDRILSMSIGQHSAERRGVLVARVTSDVESMSEFFGWGALAWVAQSMTMLVVGVTMLRSSRRCRSHGYSSSSTKPSCLPMSRCGATWVGISVGFLS